MRLLIRGAVLAVVLFVAQFGATLVTYRHLTDDVLSEDQKMEKAGLLFGPVLGAHLALAVVLAAVLMLLIGRRG